jgi:hypothetical protein
VPGGEGFDLADVHVRDAPAADHPHRRSPSRSDVVLSARA